MDQQQTPFELPQQKTMQKKLFMLQTRHMMAGNEMFSEMLEGHGVKLRKFKWSESRAG
jgi:hypothetical protein